jgi:hypothetical protein
MNTNLSSGKFDLGALASRRRVTAKLAGETPALSGANLRFAATDRDFYRPQANSFCKCSGFR